MGPGRGIVLVVSIVFAVGMPTPAGAAPGRSLEARTGPTTTTTSPPVDGGNGIRQFWGVAGYLESVSGCDEIAGNPNLITGPTHTSNTGGFMWLKRGVLYNSYQQNDGPDDGGKGVLREDGSFHLQYPKRGPLGLRTIDGQIGPVDGTGAAQVSARWTAPYPNGTSSCLRHYVSTSGDISFDKRGFGKGLLGARHKGEPIDLGPPVSSTTTPGPPVTDAPVTTTTTTPSEICPTKIVEGPFEPTQAVFQDDPTFTGEKNPQLRTVPGSPGAYSADLDMVVGRPTVLVGVERLDLDTAGPGRGTIRMRVETTGTTEVPVDLQLTGKGGASSLDSTVTVTPATLPLGGPCGETRVVEASATVGTGLPADSTFTFSKPGPYTLFAALRAAGGGPGQEYRSKVGGTAVQVPKITVRMVPVVLGKHTREEKNELAADAKQMAKKAEAQIPDYWPVEPGKFEVVFEKDPIDVSSRVENGDQGIAALKGLAEIVLDKPAKGQRLVAVIPSADAKLTDHPNAAASAESDYVMRVDPATGTPDVIAHELTHTIPKWLWVSKQMKAECGLAYHHTDFKLPASGNIPDTPGINIAHGLRLLKDGKPTREILDPERSWMTRTAKWVDQCTWRHLLQNLPKIEGPPKAK